MSTIRPALAKDESVVFGLASLLSPRFVVEKTAFVATFERLRESESVYLYVIEASGEVIGYLLGWIQLAFYSNGPVGWVQEIVIHPDYRRRKLGQLLMNDFESWVAGRGGNLVSLATRGATDFYQSLGYTESAAYYKKSIQPRKMPKLISGGD